MSNDLSSASLDFSGDAAVEQAIAVLRRFADDDQFDQVHIDLSTSWQHTPEESRQAKLYPAEDEEKEASEKKQISAGTSHHKVLTIIAELDTQAQVPVIRVIENTDIPEGTVYAAMSTLHERGLVTRQKGPEGNYLYTITEFGESEIKRLGRADV